MKKSLLLAFIFVGLFIKLEAQPIFPENGQLYIDTVVPRIDITVNPDTLEWLYQEENLENDIEFHAVFVFNNGTVIDTIDPVGFRLRGNTSRYSNKKSFKVSFNRFTKGGKYYGVEKLNLGTLFTGNKLNIVHQQCIRRTIFISEHGRCFAANCRD